MLPLAPLGVACCAMLIAGCGAIVRTDRGAAAGAGLERSPAALASLVEARRAAFRSLRATGKLQVTIDAQRGNEIRRNRFRASQAILVEAPSSFRLEALSPFGVSYAVASDGKRLAILLPSEGVVYRGEASLETVAAATGVAATPNDVAALLLGQVPMPPLDLDHAWISEPAAPAADPSAPVSAPAVLLHATARDDRSDLVVIGFAPAASGLLPVLYERITSAGVLVLRARFGAFESTVSGPFATRVEIQAHSSEAVLTYADVEVNPLLEARRFAIATPANGREIDLGASLPSNGDPEGLGPDPRS